MPLGKLHFGEVAACQNTPGMLPLGKISLGCCRLAKYPWDVAAWQNTPGMLPFGKISLGCCRLGKYPWDVAAWQNIPGMLPLGKIPLGCCRLGKYLTMISRLGYSAAAGAFIGTLLTIPIQFLVGKVIIVYL